MGSQFSIESAGHIIKQIPIRGLYEQVMLLDSYLILLCEEARTLEFRYQTLWRKRGEGM